jgi:hypothetical protein
LNNNASAYRIELLDGNYKLVPESEGEPAEGEVNVVEVQQDPDQSSDNLSTDFASEGKPRSITYFVNLCNPLCDACAFTFRSLIETLDA